MRRARNRLNYGPIEDAPGAYGENPLFYKQLVQEMDDVTGYVFQGDQSTVLNYVPGFKPEQLDEPVDGDTAFAWVEDTLSEMSEVDNPFREIRFTVTYREQDGQRHVRLHGLHELSFFRGERYDVELEGTL